MKTMTDQQLIKLVRDAALADFCRTQDADCMSQPNWGVLALLLVARLEGHAAAYRELGGHYDKEKDRADALDEENATVVNVVRDVIRELEDNLLPLIPSDGEGRHKLGTIIADLRSSLLDIGVSPGGEEE